MVPAQEEGAAYFFLVPVVGGSIIFLFGTGRKGAGRMSLFPFGTNLRFRKKHDGAYLFLFVFLLVPVVGGCSKKEYISILYSTNRRKQGKEEYTTVLEGSRFFPFVTVIVGSRERRIVFSFGRFRREHASYFLLLVGGSSSYSREK